MRERERVKNWVGEESERRVKWNQALKKKRRKILQVLLFHKKEKNRGGKWWRKRRRWREKEEKERRWRERKRIRITYSSRAPLHSLSDPNSLDPSSSSFSLLFPSLSLSFLLSPFPFQLLTSYIPIPLWGWTPLLGLGWWGKEEKEERKREEGMSLDSLSLFSITKKIWIRTVLTPRFFLVHPSLPFPDSHFLFFFENRDREGRERREKERERERMWGRGQVHISLIRERGQEWNNFSPTFRLNGKKEWEMNEKRWQEIERRRRKKWKEGRNGWNKKCDEKMRLDRKKRPSWTS